MQTTEIVMTGIGEPEALEVRSRTLPGPKPGEALVRVEVSGVASAEQQMRRGRYPGAPRFPFVPGYDFVGVVEELGAGNTAGLHVGQRVAAMVKAGGWAERAVVPTSRLVPVPDGLSAEQAETLILNGLTAWQLLHRLAKVQPGQTVLVQGAAGGVGVLLVQLARLAGARVIGTASAGKHDLLRRLGAEPVDYRGDVPAEVRRLAPGGLDAVFDHMGGAALDELWPLLGRNGVLASYGSMSTLTASGSPLTPVLRIMASAVLRNLTPGRGRAAFYNVWGGRVISPRRFAQRMRADLTTVFRLAVEGTLSGEIAARIPLRQAAEAMRLAESGTATGKVLLVP